MCKKKSLENPFGISEIESIFIENQYTHRRDENYGDTMFLTELGRVIHPNKPSLFFCLSKNELNFLKLYLK